VVVIAWASCPSGRRGDIAIGDIAIKAADAAATTARHDLPGETLSRDRRLFAAVEVGANSTSRTTIRVRQLSPHRRVLTKDSPENRSFFGEGVKVVVEVVVDPQGQIDHFDDLDAFAEKAAVFRAIFS